MLNRARINAFNNTLRTSWNKAFAELIAEATPADGLAMATDSDGESENYGFLKGMPTVKEWISDRHFESLDNFTYELRNKSWETGLSVDRDHIEDDRTGLYTNYIGELALVARQHMDELLWGLVNDGFTSFAYDGQYFFDTDHDFGSNKGTAALTRTSFRAAVLAMRQYTTPDGRKNLKVRPRKLVVPPSLEQTGRDIVVADDLAGGGGEANPDKNRVELLVVDELEENPTRWFLVDDSRSLKPLIKQTRRPWQFIAKVDEETDEQAFMRKKFLYACDARHNAGYGFPQLMWGSDGTT